MTLSCSTMRSKSTDGSRHITSPIHKVSLLMAFTSLRTRTLVMSATKWYTRTIKVRTSGKLLSEILTVFNTGVVLSGLRRLWEATGDTLYLTDGYALIETVINATGWYAPTAAQATQWAGLGRNGIMEDYCDAPANCSQDNQIFKGIYFHHLDLFCEPLPTSAPLIAGLTSVASSELATEHLTKCHGYAPWIEHNAHAALSTRNSSGIIGGWWGATYVNKTQGPWPNWAPPKPPGSKDEWNHRNILDEPPWLCHGQHGCHRGGRKVLDGSSKRSAMASIFNLRRKRDINDRGLGRTVETQGSGLGVVKAASDFTLRRPAT